MTDRMRTTCTLKLCNVTWKLLRLNQHCVINDYLLCTPGSITQTGQKKTEMSPIYFMASCHIAIIGGNKERDNRSLLERKKCLM